MAYCNEECRKDSSVELVVGSATHIFQAELFKMEMCAMLRGGLAMWATIPIQYYF